MGQGFGSMRHLTVRLLGSLWPGGPRPGGEQWARTWLLPSEQGLWARMSGADRRHALGVAKEVGTQLGIADGDPERRPVMAAALLHDVGKIESRFGTWSRVAATLVAIKVGRDAVAAWAGPGSGWRSRAGRYVTHDQRGGDLLARAGSDPFTVAWASQHHQPVARRTVDPMLGAVLEAADGD